MNPNSQASMEHAQSYRDAFGQLQPAAAGAPWLQALRKRALQNFIDQGFPTTAEENWRYTDLTEVAERSADYLDGAPPERSEDYTGIIEAQGLQLPDMHALVFVNGIYQPEYSLGVPTPKGVYISRFHDVADQRTEWLTRGLGTIADIDESRLAAFNTAFLNDGVILLTDDDQQLTETLYVLNVVVGDKTVVQPRLLLSLGRGSSATVVEHYLSTGPSFTNAITEIHCAPGARLEYCKLQQEHESAFHLAGQHVRLDDDSWFHGVHVDLGAQLSRNDLQVELRGKGAETSLHGLFMAQGNGHIDNHTLVDHAAPHCSSREDYRGVLADKGRGIFNGKILVQVGAQKTDAELQSRNLLLSPGAEIDTKPELEIYADDVKCSHGATTGQLDQDAMFYLRTKGISQLEARSMLVTAFTQVIVDRIGSAELRAPVAAAVGQRLAHADLESLS
jgi:Fe-S cluster assembly protein SufD